MVSLLEPLVTGLRLVWLCCNASAQGIDSIINVMFWALVKYIYCGLYYLTASGKWEWEAFIHEFYSPAACALYRRNRAGSEVHTRQPAEFFKHRSAWNPDVLPIFIRGVHEALTPQQLGMSSEALLATNRCAISHMDALHGSIAVSENPSQRLASRQVEKFDGWNHQALKNLDVSRCTATGSVKLMSAMYDVE